MSKSNASCAAYPSVDQFLKDVSGQFEGLSRQLKVIAQYVERNRGHLALEGVQDVAQRCAVQPSAIVRFAKHFGFSGFSEMQQLFRDGVVRQIAPMRNYQDRIRDVIESKPRSLTPAGIAGEVIGGSIASLETLLRDPQETAFARAVELLTAAPAIWVIATRRSFPAGAYLAYSLQHTDKPVHWLTGIGHIEHDALRALHKGDVMIAVSFTPYAQETVSAAEEAAQRGAKLVAITDSQMSPLARLAAASLVVQENATFGFRSLTGTMSLAQALFIALAYKLQLQYESPVRAGRASYS